MNITISNAVHPEYGVASIPFPIPESQYEHIVYQLGEIEVGDPRKKDCFINEVRGTWPVLKRLEDSIANLEELDFLFKRLDGFDIGEAAQFQAMAEKMNLKDIKDLINLTFCCQQATVITDFSDLNAVGRDHYMNLNGGCAKTEELDKLDTRETALMLIGSGAGVVTPYGVVYDNGLKLSQQYKGNALPPYSYNPSLMDIEVRSKNESYDPVYIYLPAPMLQIERALQRVGIDMCGNMEFEVIGSRLPVQADVILLQNQEDIQSLNDMCVAIAELNHLDMKKLGAVIAYVGPNAYEITRLAENIGLFDFAPDVKTPEEYGRYMIEKSGHFDYDERLDEYYDFHSFGLDRIQCEDGAFVQEGYVTYMGALSLDELLVPEEPGKTMEMGGMQ